MRPLFFLCAILFLTTSSLFGNCCSEPCNAPCRNFYLGFEGGWGDGLGKASKDRNAGEVGFTGTVVNNAHAFFGSVAGAELGYRFYEWLRSDISYTFLHHRYNWDTIYTPIEINPSRAYLDAHLVLINGYVHLQRVLTCLRFIDPYIGGGIGVAINRLHENFEIDIFGDLLSEVKAKVHATFGARIGAGILIPVTQCIVFDAAFNANYMGTVRSGNTRRLLINQVVLPFNAFIFKHNWIGAFTLGIKYNF